MSQKIKIVYLSAVLIFGIGAIFCGGWYTGKRTAGIVETKEAYYLKFDSGTQICILRPSLMASMFGQDWRKAEIYSRYTGYKGLDSSAIIDGPLYPMTSLVLDFGNFEAGVEGGAQEVYMSLFSRKTRQGYTMIIDLKKRKLLYNATGKANVGREVMLPSGALTFPPNP